MPRELLSCVALLLSQNLDGAALESTAAQRTRVPCESVFFPGGCEGDRRNGEYHVVSFPGRRAQAVLAGGDGGGRRADAGAGARHEAAVAGRRRPGVLPAQPRVPAQRLR